jgi:hypothetical protein
MPATMSAPSHAARYSASHCVGGNTPAILVHPFMEKVRFQIEPDWSDVLL